MNKIGDKMASRASRRINNRIFAFLCALTVLATSTALILQAISMTDPDLVCTTSEHFHSSTCYEKVLACNVGGTGDHVHADSCYEEQLVCSLPEHVHDVGCYKEGSQSEPSLYTIETTGSKGGIPISIVAEPFESTQDSFAFNVTEIALSDVGNKACHVITGKDIGLPPDNRFFSIPLIEIPHMSASCLTAAKIEIPCKSLVGLSIVNEQQYEHLFVIRIDDGQSMIVDLLDVAAASPFADCSFIFEAEKSGVYAIVSVKGDASELADIDFAPMSEETDVVNHSEMPADISENISQPTDEDVQDILISDSSNFITTDDEVAQPTLDGVAGELIVVGDGYSVSASFDESAKIPQGAKLEVSELVEGDKGYDEYLSTAADLDQTSVEDGSARCYRKVFDIRFTLDGKEIEPASDVSMKVHFDEIPDGSSTSASVVHFAESGAEDLNAKCDGDVGDVSFSAPSFSVYAVSFTVEFAYAVDGDVYEYVLDGFDIASLKDVLKDLHVGGDDFEDFFKHVKSVSFSNPDLVGVHHVRNGSENLGEAAISESWIFPWTLVAPEDEVRDRNSRSFEEGDWIIASLAPFDSEEKLTVELDDTQSFTIVVTDDQSAPTNPDGSVQTISNPAGTTINLFDYWVDNRNATGRSAWPGGWNGSGWNNITTVNGVRLQGSGNNVGINKNHNFKFSPAWGGTVMDGTLNRASADGNFTINSWTKSADPTQGLVTDSLMNGYPKLTINRSKGTDGESLQYLFDPAYNHGGKASYSGANQLFYVDPDGYYTYDSRDYKAEFNTSSNTFSLSAQTSNDVNERGFWPFGSQKFWLGMHISTQFSMPNNGEVLNPLGVLKPMEFDFSGDDDVWIYVDGVLVGDAGGVHNKTRVHIDFQSGTVKVDGTTDPDHVGTFSETRYLDDIYKAADAAHVNDPSWTVKYNDDEWEPIPGVSGHKRFKSNTYHNFDFFYLERGGGESNLFVRYNLVSTTDFTAHKAYRTEVEGDRLDRDRFQFELVGFDGKYRVEDGTFVLEDASSRAIMPAGGSSNGNGTIADPYRDDSHVEEMSDGSMRPGILYRTSNAEDGNISFGSATISESDMHDADEGNPPVYLYMVREIVPNDAVNTNGIRWEDADTEQKAAGPFELDGISYDSTVYYMACRVTSWNDNGTIKYGLSKTYYSDDSYSTLLPDTSFINFDNARKIVFGDVSFGKTDMAGSPLAGAQFAMFLDSACNDPLMVGGTVVQAVSGADGTVCFEHIPVGTYYMKEVSAPDGYALDSSVYRVEITDPANPSTASAIFSDQDRVSSIVNSQDGIISVVKRWLSPDGSQVSPNNRQAYVKIQRYQVKESDLVDVFIRYADSYKSYSAGGCNTGMHIRVPANSDVRFGYSGFHNSSNNQNVYPYLKTVVGNRSSQGSHSSVLNSGRYDVVYHVGSEDVCFWLWANHGNTQATDPRFQFVLEPVDGISADYEIDSQFNASAPITLLDMNGGYSVSWNVGGNRSEHLGYDLPATDNNGFPYRYYIVEVDENGSPIEIGQAIESGSLSKLVGYSSNNADGISYEGVIYVDNSVPTAELIIDKVDNNSHPLSGAVFQLSCKTDGGVYELVSSDLVSGLGRVEIAGGSWESVFVTTNEMHVISGLVDGDYRLKEVLVPDGYIKLTDYIDFSVSDGKVFCSAAQDDETLSISGQSSSHATLTVTNTPGNPLPVTGGKGRIASIPFGIIMIAASIVMLSKNRFRRTVSRRWWH